VEGGWDVGVRAWTRARAAVGGCGWGGVSMGVGGVWGGKRGGGRRGGERGKGSLRRRGGRLGQRECVRFAWLLRGEWVW